MGQLSSACVAIPKSYPQTVDLSFRKPAAGVQRFDCPYIERDPTCFVTNAQKRMTLSLFATRADIFVT